MTNFNLSDFLKQLTCQSDCCKSNNIQTSGNENKIILEINTHPNTIHTKDEEIQKNKDSPKNDNDLSQPQNSNS
jgi:hypothetical protein